MTLPAQRDTHYIANDPNARHSDDYRCSMTGCAFRIPVAVYGPSEARRLAHGHIFDPSATVQELVGFRTRRGVEDDANLLRPAAPTTYVSHITREDA